MRKYLVMICVGLGMCCGSSAVARILEPFDDQAGLGDYQYFPQPYDYYCGNCTLPAIDTALESVMGPLLPNFETAGVQAAWLYALQQYAAADAAYKQSLPSDIYANRALATAIVLLQVMMKSVPSESYQEVAARLWRVFYLANQGEGSAFANNTVDESQVKASQKLLGAMQSAMGPESAILKGSKKFTSILRATVMSVQEALKVSGASEEETQAVLDLIDVKGNQSCVLTGVDAVPCLDFNECNNPEESICMDDLPGILGVGEHLSGDQPLGGLLSKFTLREREAFAAFQMTQQKQFDAATQLEWLLSFDVTHLKKSIQVLAGSLKQLNAIRAWSGDDTSMAHFLMGGSFWGKTGLSYANRLLGLMRALQKQDKAGEKLSKAQRKQAQHDLAELHYFETKLAYNLLLEASQQQGTSNPKLEDLGRLLETQRKEFEQVQTTADAAKILKEKALQSGEEANRLLLDAAVRFAVKMSETGTKFVETVGEHLKYDLKWYTGVVNTAGDLTLTANGVYQIYYGAGGVYTAWEQRSNATHVAYLAQDLIDGIDEDADPTYVAILDAIANRSYIPENTAIVYNTMAVMCRVLGLFLGLSELTMGRIDLEDSASYNLISSRITGFVAITLWTLVADGNAFSKIVLDLLTHWGVVGYEGEKLRLIEEIEILNAQGNGPEALARTLELVNIDPDTLAGVIFARLHSNDLATVEVTVQMLMDLGFDLEKVKNLQKSNNPSDAKTVILSGLEFIH